MSKYFASLTTRRIHNVEKANGTCKSSLNKEHYREFNSLEEVKTFFDKPVKKCKVCMRDEENWNKVFRNRGE